MRERIINRMVRLLPFRGNGLQTTGLGCGPRALFARLRPYGSVLFDKLTSEMN